MKLKDLHKLKKLCNTMIYFYKDNFYIKILPAFNLVNEHPININRFKFVIEKKYSKIFIYLISSIIIYKYKMFLNFFHKKYSPESFFSTLDEKYDNIFVSHLVNDETKSENDFYFKNLPIISAEKRNTLVILIDHNNLAKRIAKKIYKKRYTTLILSNNLPIKIKFIFFFKTMRVFFRILKDLIFSNNDKYILFNSLASLFRENTQMTYRLSYQFNLIFNKFKPKNIFFTYEGYSWEKALCILINSKYKDTKTIGFQHTKIYSKTLFKNEIFEKEMEPNIILTTGKFSSDVFSENKKFSQIINIGKPDKKEAYKIKDKIGLDKNIRICVLPEGIDDECYRLISFALKCAKKYKDLIFVCRFHPLTNFNKLYKAIDLKKKLPQNIIISNSNLESDLKKSNYALYRGSASIFTAMKNGVIPVYLMINDEVNIGITDNKYDWHLIANTPDDFYRKIINTFNDNYLKKNRDDIIKFYNKYFENFNYTKFEKIVSQ